jgi:hypothetical protein
MLEQIKRIEDALIYALFNALDIKEEGFLLSGSLCVNGVGTTGKISNQLILDFEKISWHFNSL